MSTYEMQFNAASSGLQLGHNSGTIHVNSESSNTRSVKQAYNIPEDRLSRYFTGRYDELQQIEEFYQNSRTKGPARCVIHAMPGIGKTQLALRFAILARPRYSFVFWVSAATSDKINTDFSHIYSLVTRDSGNLDTLVVKAQKWLEANDDWLLVADNVNHDTMQHLGDLLPQADTKGHILITTRFTDVAEALGHARGEQHSILELKGLKPTDAADLFLATSASGRETHPHSKSAESSAVVILVSALGFLPLAIDHAGAFSKTSGHTPREILKFHGSEHSTQLFQWEHTLSKHEARSIASLFEPILEQIQRTAPLAYDILQLLTYLEPESLWMDMVKRGLNEYVYWKTSRSIWSRSYCKIQSSKSRQSKSKDIRALQPVIEIEEDEVKECISRLQPVFGSPPLLAQNLQVLLQSSLLHRKDVKRKIFWMHDLVQTFLRHRNTSPVWRNVALCVVTSACFTAPDFTKSSSWSRAEIYLTHFSAISRQLNMPGDRSVRLLMAQNSMSLYLLSAGRYYEAKKLIKEGLATFASVLGEQHAETLTSLYHLTWICLEDKATKEAVTHGERYLKLAADSPKEHNKGIFIIKSLLAGAYASVGRFQDAKRLVREMIRQTLKLKPIDVEQMIKSLASLAKYLHYDGRYADSELITRQVCYWKQKLLGNEDLDTVWSMEELAFTIHAQNRREAVEFLRQVLVLRIKLSGDNHSYTKFLKETIIEWQSEDPSTLIGNPSKDLGYPKDLLRFEPKPELVPFLTKFLQLTKTEIESSFASIESQIS